MGTLFIWNDSQTLPSWFMLKAVRLCGCTLCVHKMCIFCTFPRDFNLFKTMCLQVWFPDSPVPEAGSFFSLWMRMELGLREGNFCCVNGTEKTWVLNHLSSRFTTLLCSCWPWAHLLLNCDGEHGSVAAVVVCIYIWEALKKSFVHSTAWLNTIMDSSLF